MVWFYRIFQSNLSLLASVNFQSHYGLILSSSTLPALLTTRFDFQSHYGLILSCHAVNFHSAVSALSIPLWSDFICITRTQNRAQNYPFNPTMVWFYPFPRPWERSRGGCLSIPLWSDFISVSYRLQQYAVECALSIPLWSDFILSGRELRRINSEVSLSIPLWSDFIAWRILQKRLRSARFQSHYGLILSWQRTEAAILGENFQSHYGLILSVCLCYLISLSCEPFNPTMVWFYQPVIFLCFAI